jgi:hypothetical protein
MKKYRCKACQCSTFPPFFVDGVALGENYDVREKGRRCGRQEMLSAIDATHTMSSALRFSFHCSTSE